VIAADHPSWGGAEAGRLVPSVVPPGVGAAPWGRLQGAVQPVPCEPCRRSSVTCGAFDNLHLGTVASLRSRASLRSDLRGGHDAADEVITMRGIRSRRFSSTCHSQCPRTSSASCPHHQTPERRRPPRPLLQPPRRRRPRRRRRPPGPRSLGPARCHPCPYCQPSRRHPPTQRLRRRSRWPRRKRPPRRTRRPPPSIPPRHRSTLRNGLKPQ
jgi:hypothetical protein